MRSKPQIRVDVHRIVYVRISWIRFQNFKVHLRQRRRDGIDPEAICYVRQLPGVARRSSWSADPGGNACTESLPQRNKSTNTYSRCLWPTTKTSCHVICLCVAIRHKCIKLKASASNFKVQTSKKAESRLAGHRIDDSDVRVCLEHGGR